MIMDWFIYLYTYSGYTQFDMYVDKEKKEGCDDRVLKDHLAM